MDRSSHTLSCLFSQLGLESDRDHIADFILDNQGIPSKVTIDKADIWSPAQAEFLKESLAQGSDWAEVVDMLDALLR